MSVLKVKEIFFSLQGEGTWTGTPMTFIRLSGCDNNCVFCDTDYKGGKDMNVQEILETVAELPTCRRVCVTGGEPLLQMDELRVLIRFLLDEGYKVHLETSRHGNELLKFGSLLHNVWVTCSPKSRVTQHVLYVDEYKWLVGHDIEPFYRDVIKDPGKFLGTVHFLQPVWGPDYFCNLELAMTLCKDYPELFRLGLQIHKYLNIP